MTISTTTGGTSSKCSAKNRPTIEDIARRKYLSGDVEPDGAVLIRTADIPH